MTESFLHHLWKFKLFNQHNLKTTEGDELQILKAGQHNSDAGPDFFNAQVKLANTQWAGNVEIHLKSSDWKKHFHQKDNSYDNIILHVVYEDDEKLFRKDGTVIPTFELKNKFNQKLWDNYDNLLASKQWIPCEHRIRKVDGFTITSWMERLLVERLERKTEIIFDSLSQNKNNWEETFYQQLAKNFGFKINSLPFEMLAKSLPVAHLAKHKDHLFQLEALFFGQSGLLGKKYKDDYPNKLKKEYDFLKSKFNLTPMETHQWKFLRLRPANFPTIRIAQFASLVNKSSHLFSKVIDAKSLKEIRNLFDVTVSDYWLTHFVFDKVSPKRSKLFGNSAIETIVINTIVPFLFAYGKSRDSEVHEQRAFKLLEELPEENNSIINKWNSIGIKSQSAYQTQALLQLKNEYCSEKKCLTCSIGNKIINSLP